MSKFSPGFNSKISEISISKLSRFIFFSLFSVSNLIFNNQSSCRPGCSNQVLVGIIPLPTRHATLLILFKIPFRAINAENPRLFIYMAFEGCQILMKILAFWKKNHSQQRRRSKNGVFTPFWGTIRFGVTEYMPAKAGTFRAYPNHPLASTGCVGRVRRQAASAMLYIACFAFLAHNRLARSRADERLLGEALSVGVV